MYTGTRYTVTILGWKKKSYEWFAHLTRFCLFIRLTFSSSPDYDQESRVSYTWLLRLFMASQRDRLIYAFVYITFEQKITLKQNA